METEQETTVRFALLVVDEDGENLELFRKNFRTKYSLFTSGSVEEAVSSLNSHQIAVAVVEYSVGGQRGIELLAEAGRIQPYMVGILMSESTSEELLIEAINTGNVWKFIKKPWTLEDMESVLDEALKKYSSSLTENNRLKSVHEIADYYSKEIISECGFDFVIGHDGDLAEVMDKIGKVASSPLAVHLFGEPGAGKELMARTLHHLSDRAEAPFIKLDAAYLPENLTEEELFGKDGKNGRVIKGRAQLANSGTLFVENVHLLSLEAQFKLAELIGSGAFERVDDSRQIKVDVRVVTSTTADLEEMVAARTFRKDLLERLSEYPVEIPSLRNRPRDIVALAQFFASKSAKSQGMGSIRLDESAIERIAQYDWPGNLKELTNIMGLAILRCRDAIIKAGDIGPFIRTYPAAEPSTPAKELPDRRNQGDLKNRMADIEREEIIEALRKAGGKKALAARLLGINRSTLYYRMKKFRVTQ